MRLEIESKLFSKKTNGNDILESVRKACYRKGQEIAATKEGFCVGKIGMIFRGTTKVRVEKPKWMPESLYQTLMRTIIVEEHDTR